jgi:ferritin-like metal-binding protein YciE
MSSVTLQEQLEVQLRDIHSAERQLHFIMPSIIHSVHNRALAQVLEDHFLESTQHIVRLELEFERLGFPPRSASCRSIIQIIEETLAECSRDLEPEIRDACLVSACQRIEQFELAMYGTARFLAYRLGLNQLRDQLDLTIAEEAAAETSLRRIADREINPAAFAPRAVSSAPAQRPRRNLVPVGAVAVRFN